MIEPDDKLDVEALISDLKAVKSENEEILRILQDLPKGIVILNKDLNVEFINNRLKNLLNIRTKSIKKLSAFDYIHPDFRNIVLNLQNKRLSDDLELKLVSTAGNWFWASIQIDSIYFDGKKCNFLLVSDIS
ncbi:PAS domain-containing protein, partial [Candidatus Kapabacteria bacterium]|nr:PAS domain-containing protein [Candidatus Kapabacteria bacterium]